jgi:hypothetical protein
MAVISMSVSVPRLVRCDISILLLAVLVGCGSKTSPVNGRVKFKDGSDVSVLKGFTVSFEPEADRISGSGELDSDGKFTITTFSANDGAIPGRHRVAISPPDPIPDAPPPKPVLPQKYRDFGTSGLTAEIKPGVNNVEFELERAP